MKFVAVKCIEQYICIHLYIYSFFMVQEILGTHLC
jgi:hypothetical protein